MDEQKVASMIANAISQSAIRSQYNVSPGFFHTHNNIDSPWIDWSNLQNAPGYFDVATSTTGTTAVPVLSITKSKFNLTITGVYLTSKDTTAGNISLYNNGATVATIAKGTVAGAMVGATSLLNTSYLAGNSLAVLSSSVGNATVYVTFTA